MFNSGKYLVFEDPSSSALGQTAMEGTSVSATLATLMMYDNLASMSLEAPESDLDVALNDFDAAMRELVNL